MHFELDDKIYRDHRFQRLVMAVGDPHRALGICVSAWVLSFEYWKQDKKPIPRVAWGASGLGQEMIEVGLARYINGGESVYVCGSEDKHAWYFIAKENGRIGGLKSRRKKVRPPKGPLEGDQPSSPSPSPFPDSVTGTSTFTGSEGGAEAPSHRAANKPNNPLSGKTWEAYASAYFARYHTEPVRNATINGQIAQLVRRLGSEAPDVVGHFLQQGGFYASRHHAIGLCLKDAEALRTQWATGTASPPATMSKNDQLEETVRRQREMIRRGEL